MYVKKIIYLVLQYICNNLLLEISNTIEIKILWYQSRPGNPMWGRRHNPTKWALTRTLGI